MAGWNDRLVSTSTAPVTAPSSGDPELERWLSGTRRSHGLWWLPVGGVIAVAVAGQAAGTPGALVVAAEIIAVALFRAGFWLSAAKPAGLALAGTIVATAVIAVGLWQAGPGRADRPVGSPDLRGKEIGHEVRGLNLRGARLAGSVFTDRDLAHVDFSGVQAAGASFHGANLTTAVFRGADLRGADFSGACLRDANLDGADLTGADVTDAFVDGAEPDIRVLVAAHGVKGSPRSTPPDACG